MIDIYKAINRFYNLIKNSEEPKFISQETWETIIEEINIEKSEIDEFRDYDWFEPLLYLDKNTNLNTIDFLDIRQTDAKYLSELRNMYMFLSSKTTVLDKYIDFLIKIVGDMKDENKEDNHEMHDELLRLIGKIDEAYQELIDIPQELIDRLTEGQHSLFVGFYYQKEKAAKYDDKEIIDVKQAEEDYESRINGMISGIRSLLTENFPDKGDIPPKLLNFGIGSLSLSYKKQELINEANELIQLCHLFYRNEPDKIKAVEKVKEIIEDMFLLYPQYKDLEYKAYDLDSLKAAFVTVEATERINIPLYSIGGEIEDMKKEIKETFINNLSSFYGKYYELDPQLLLDDDCDLDALMVGFE